MRSLAISWGAGQWEASCPLACSRRLLLARAQGRMNCQSQLMYFRVHDALQVPHSQTVWSLAVPRQLGRCRYSLAETHTTPFLRRALLTLPYYKNVDVEQLAKDKGLARLVQWFQVSITSPGKAMSVAADLQHWHVRAGTALSVQRDSFCFEQFIGYTNARHHSCPVLVSKAGVLSGSQRRPNSG